MIFFSCICTCLDSNLKKLSTTQNYSGIHGTFLSWVILRGFHFCIPGWPGISDPLGCLDYGCVSALPSKTLLTEVPQLLCRHLGKAASYLEMGSESEPCHTTVPCFKIFFSQFLKIVSSSKI